MVSKKFFIIGKGHYKINVITSLLKITFIYDPYNYKDVKVYKILFLNN